MQERTYTVPGMTCGHCEAAVRTLVGRVPGVSAVSVDLATKLVVVAGASLSDEAIRAAIDDAGFDVGP